MSYDRYFAEIADIHTINVPEGFFSFKIEDGIHMRIHAVWVKPELRGKGAYASLFKHMEIVGRELGAKQMYGTLRYDSKGFNRALCARLKNGATVVQGNEFCLTVQKEL